jgi:2-oxoglutarate ferredoxin oxidoreductase subunit delta
MAGALTRGTVLIDTDMCKGCELCIEACPPQVLSMSQEINEKGFHFPLLTPGCTSCRACQQVCPDYVFEVYRFEQPVIVTDARSERK